jgi:hypothetical protein
MHSLIAGGGKGAGLQPDSQHVNCVQSEVCTNKHFAALLQGLLSVQTASQPLK